MPLLIARRMRRPAFAAAMGAWVVATVLGLLVAGQGHAGPLDRVLIHRVHATVGNRSGLAAALLAPTDTPVILAAALVLVVAALARRRWNVALLAVATPAIGVGAAELVLKPLFGRRLHGDLSYPSGHAVAAVAVYTVAVLAVVSTAARPWRHVALAGWGVLTVVIMTGLVGMDCHYPTDTIGGVCVAVGVVLPCVLGTDAYLRRPAGHGELLTPPGRAASAGRRS